MKRNILSTGEESNRFARKNYLIHLSRHCKFAFYSTTMPFPHTCIHTHTHTTLYVLESSIREIESREFAVSSLSLWFGVHLPPPPPIVFSLSAGKLEAISLEWPETSHDAISYRAWPMAAAR